MYIHLKKEKQTKYIQMHSKKWVINVNTNIASHISVQKPTLFHTRLHSYKHNIDT